MCEYGKLIQSTETIVCPSCKQEMEDTYGIEDTVDENYEKTDILVSLFHGVPFSHWTPCDHCGIGLRVEYVNPRVQDEDVIFDLNVKIEEE